MNIFGIGLPEMGLIMIVALLVFGPKKLPEVGRGVAKTLNELKKASKDFENELKKGTESLEQSVVAPMKATLEEPKVLTANTSASTSKVKTKAEDEPMAAEAVEVATVAEPEVAEPEIVAEAEDLEPKSETVSKTVAEASAESNFSEQS